MRGTSVRKDLSGLDRLGQIDELRARMQAVTGVVPEKQSAPEEDDALDVGLPLCIPRRAVTEISDCPALVVDLLAKVTAAGGHVGIVGWPQLSLAAIEHLDKVIAVPDPGPDPLGITSVLVEGLDLVVHHSAVELNLSPVRARPLTGRLRGGEAALLLVGLHAPSPALRIDARVSTYRGIGRGTGRISGMDIDVSMTAKAEKVRTTVVVGQRPHLRAV